MLNIKNIDLANKKLLNKIIKDAKKNNSIEAVYLFGSVVSGKQLPYSDIDVCIITKKGFFGELDLLNFKSEKIDVVLFWNLPIYIRYRVLKEGTLLFARNDSFLTSLSVATIREYIDFKPLIDRYAKEYFGDHRWTEKE